MSIVKIPTTHFVNSAKRQYSDIDTAIIREAVQNSVDAGATNIRIETGPTWVSVIDNGCGMNEQVLVDAMLTMSGSFKSSDSAIGGFGAAKEILLFQHDKYEIHTQDNKVVGSILEYEMFKTDYIHGTSITMHFHDSYNFQEGLFVAKAKVWLSKCDAPAFITINGDKVKSVHAKNEVKDLGWGKLYCDNIKDPTDMMTVRIKGVCMFQVHIGEIKKRIILEITKPSTEIMTSNRDGFQWEYAQQVQKLVEEITIDKASFGRYHNTITRLAGNNRSFISRVIRQILTNDLNDTRSDIIAARTQIESLEKDVQDGLIDEHTAITKIKEISKELPSSGVINRKLDDFINDVDFYVQINDKGYNKIPDEISPSRKMKKKYYNLACLWKAALKHVFSSNGLDSNFCIGWIIDSDALAMFTRRDGNEMYLLNPYLIHSKINKKNKKEMVYNLLVTAAHEVAHRSCKYHDEVFSAHTENLLLKSISSLSSHRELICAAKKESI